MAMTREQKLAYSESTLWRNQFKAIALPYASSVVHENQDTLVPDPAQSREYHQRRIRISDRCLQAPDQFAQQNAAVVILDPAVADPLTATDQIILTACQNLWKTLSGGEPVAPLPPPETPAAAAFPLASPIR